MDEAQRYVATVRARMVGQGFEVSDVTVGDLPAVIGYISRFRWRWMATRLHLFVCVAPMPHVTPEWLEHFTRAALNHAERTKGATRGMQSGVAAIAALAGLSVDPRAVSYAQRELLREFASFSWPVTYDATARKLTSHLGRPFIGWVYTKWMRQQIAACLDRAT